MSKEARNRALEAICNAQGRTFLAAAPLMAIVEAVQVLDEAGLLGAVATRSEEVTRAADAMSRESAAAEEAMRRGIVVAVNLDNEEDIRDQLQKVLDGTEVTNAALALCELVDDAEKAKAVLNGEGFQGRTLEAQVRAMVVAWSVDPDVADLDLDAPTPYTLAVPPPVNEESATAPCENCCGLGWQYDPDAKVIRCDHCAVYETDEAAQEAKAAVERLAAANAQVPDPCALTGGTWPTCSACGQDLASNGECLNFPACRNAIIPF